jgi:hypothetical protein
MPERNKKQRLILLKEEKDRFHAMRVIQQKSRKYRQWLALVFSTFAFGVLWCVGAVVFWQVSQSQIHTFIWYAMSQEDGGTFVFSTLFYCG